MFILINSKCFGHYYAHHQENRLCKQLHVEYAWLCWQQSCRVWDTSCVHCVKVGIDVELN